MVFSIRDLDQTQAPLLDHLIELRARLLRAFLALAVAFGVCFYFAQDILAFLVQPLRAAGQSKLIYTKLYGQFFVELKVALFAAFFLAFPIIANQLWAFVAPGLYAKEKRAFLPFLIATPVLFTAGEEEHWRRQQERQECLLLLGVEPRRDERPQLVGDDREGEEERRP